MRNLVNKVALFLVFLISWVIYVNFHFHGIVFTINKFRSADCVYLRFSLENLMTFYYICSMGR